MRLARNPASFQLVVSFPLTTWFLPCEMQYMEVRMDLINSMNLIFLWIENIKQDRDKDGFSERHVGSLLAIGTLGLNIWKEAPERSINDLEGNSSSSRQDHDLQDLTLEELGKLQNELKLILQKQAELTRTAELERNSFEWKKLLEKVSCIDSDKSTSCNDCNHQHSTSIIRNRGKDVCLDSNSKCSIGKKSLSFLLKKMFLCSSGITPAPSLRDHAVLESRMEKVNA